MESKLAELGDIKKENQALHEILNLGLDKDYDLKMAQIVGKDVAQDTLLINRGTADSVENGYAVIGSNKAVVGRIVAVYKNFSKVALLTAKESSFDVRVGDGSVDGLARGQGNFGLYLDLVSKDKNIESGAIVVTSSLGGIFPKNLVVGTVGIVQKNDAQMFQKAEILPAFTIESADSVFVVTGVNVLNDELPLKTRTTK
jgi:rod shape-determining protein MreC